MSTRCDTSHLPWHLEFRLSMGSCGCSTQIRSRSCFSTLDIAIPGDDLRAERFNSAIVADKLSRLSVVRKANGTTFSAEICLPFEPSKVFFYFGDANSSKKTKTFFTRMSSTSCCCRVSAGDASADWDTAKQTSWTLRRRPRSWNFHAVLTNRSEKEGKTSANSIIIIIMLSSCFMFLQCIRKICAFYGWRRWQSVTLVYSCHTFCWRYDAIGTAADLLPTRHRRVHCRRCCKL